MAAGTQTRWSVGVGRCGSGFQTSCCKHRHKDPRRHTPTDHRSTTNYSFASWTNATHTKIYSDGSVTNLTTHCSLAGFGVWWPRRYHDYPPTTLENDYTAHHTQGRTRSANCRPRHAISTHHRTNTHFIISINTYIYIYVRMISRIHTNMLASRLVHHF